MEVYDIVMLVILSGAVIFGAAKGMAWQIASIAALVLSYFVAVQFNEAVAAHIKLDPPLNKLAAMLVLYLGTSLAIWIGFGFVRSYIEKMSLKEFDRHAGALLGAITGVLLCVSLTLFLVTMLKEDQRPFVTRSRAGLYIAQGINHFQSAFPPAVHEALDPYIQKLNDELQAANNSGTPNSGLGAEGLPDPNGTPYPNYSQGGTDSWNTPALNPPSTLPGSQPGTYPYVPPTSPNPNGGFQTPAFPASYSNGY